MNEEYKKFLNQWQDYRRKQSKLEELRDRRKKSSANGVKVVALIGEITELRKDMDQRCLNLQALMKGGSEPVKASALTAKPLYQAINEYMTGYFNSNPELDVCEIGSAMVLQRELIQVFGVEYPLSMLQIKLDADIEQLNNGDYIFKRVDFYIPAKETATDEREND